MIPFTLGLRSDQYLRLQEIRLECSMAEHIRRALDDCFSHMEKKLPIKIIRKET